MSSHVSSPRSSQASPARSERSNSKASDKGSEKSGSPRSGSRKSRSDSVSLIDVDEDAHPFREDKKLTEILDRLGETANVRKIIHEQEIDIDSLRLLTVETLASTGVPKLSALRILDEVAKLKQAQSTVKQTEERMDNVHMSAADAEDTDALIREISGTDAKVQQEAMEDVRALVKNGKHRRALTKTLLELVAGGRHPALDASQRAAVGVLADIATLTAGREYLREQRAVTLITPVVLASADEKEFATSQAALRILTELIVLPDCLRELREYPDIAAELIHVGQVQNPDTQYAALSLLAKITLGSSLLAGEIDLLQGGGIAALYRIASSGNDNRVKGAACRVLGAACSGDHMHGYMQGKFSENYVQSIVALLNSNDEHLRAGAAYAIAYIVDDNWRHKKILRQYGTVAKLVELLSHNASPDVQEAAARAIRGVVRDSARSVGDKTVFWPWRYNVNKDLAHSVRSSGAVNALANLLKSNHAALRQAALSALYEIAAAADPAQRRQVSEACTPKTVVAALSDEDPHTHFFALLLIRELTVGNDQILEQYLLAGVVPQLKHLQASQDSEVQNLSYDIYIAYTHNKSRYNILSYSGYSVR